MKHDTIEFAAVRVRNLRARIARLRENANAGQRTAYIVKGERPYVEQRPIGERIALDEATLERWLKKFPALRGAQ